MMSNISCKPHITSNLIMLSLCVIAVVTLKMLKINITDKLQEATILIYLKKYGREPQVFKTTRLVMIELKTFPCHIRDLSPFISIFVILFAILLI